MAEFSQSIGVTDRRVGALNRFEYLLLNETIMSARRNRPATKVGYQARVFPTERIIHQMIEAVAIFIGLFSAGIFAAHVAEAHLRAGDWVGRVRSVRSMYRQAS
jgi:hypothetical protein